MDKIILFSQARCPQCRMVHMMLDNKGIQYEECQDIEEMKTLGIKHTPILRVNDKDLQGRDIFNYINGVN